MALTPGTHLGPYDILIILGAGGMGEVYKARDTRLDRTVAIKVLPSHIAASPEFLARFEREARTISQLSHPHICTLYDVGEAPDPLSAHAIHFLVMEYLEGETLAARIMKGPLPVDLALTYATQIADALNAAHRRGILHRDLKPGNVIVTPAGVTLLDFGLAKAVGPSAIAPSHVGAPTGMTSPPTMMTPLTAQGTILGTFQYMAPEVVEGDEADARADIWAFGCVLYEMLTGRRPFAGKSQAGLLGAILREDPPSVVIAQPFIPPALDRIVRACLAKDPNQRVQSAHDLLLNLQWVTEGGSASGIPAPILARRRARERSIWMGVVFAVGVLTASAAWFLKPAPQRAAMMTRFVHTLPADQRFTRVGRHTVAMSPDGSYFVYVANRQLFLRRMNETEARPIKGTEEDPLDPLISPDGQWVAYFVPSPAGTALKKIPVSGGAAIVLASLGDPFGGSWQDGTITIGQGARGIVSVPEGGGAATSLVTLQQGEVEATAPQLLNHGQNLLFTIKKAGAATWNQADIVVQSLKTGARTLVISGGHDGRVMSDGTLLYVRDATLFGARFDAGRSERTGDPVPLVAGVTESVGPGFSGSGQFAVSAEGRLLYVPTSGGPVRRTLVWVDRQGREQPIGAEPMEYVYPRISPNGKRIALSVRGSGPGGGEGRTDSGRDIWLLDLEHDILGRLESDTADKSLPIWSADGRAIIYCSTVAGRAVFLRQSADGTGVPERLVEEPGTFSSANSVSPDGNALVYLRTAGNNWDIMLLPLDRDRKAQPLIATPNDEQNGEVSPNGKWIVYESDESGRREVYVRPFPAVDTGRWQVSTNGGRKPGWSRNARELFYESADQQLTAVPVEGRPDFSYGRPAALFDLKPYFSGNEPRSYDVAADGRFVLVKEPPSSSARTVVVVEHWMDEVRARLSAGK